MITQLKSHINYLFETNMTKSSALSVFALLTGLVYLFFGWIGLVALISYEFSVYLRKGVRKCQN